MSQIKVELQSFFGDDRSIASAAWTSSTTYDGKKKKTDAQVSDLVVRLASEGHSTPFESVVLRFWMRIPISTDRQIMTHRIQSTSGMSGRYRTMPNEYLDIPDDVEGICMTLSNHEFYWPNDTKTTLSPVDEYLHICEEANNFYNALLLSLKEKEKDGALTNHEYKRMREFFRGVLPQNNMTERVSIMNLRSFANFMKLRLSPSAQPEIQEVARLMLEQVKASNVAPVAIRVLEEKGWII